MRGRCTNPKDKLFPYYGGRGIALCRRWRGPHGYKNFLKDVGRRPSKGFSLDRINNMKGYTPSNVRWATRAEQARNKRSSILITIRGREMCLKDWCRHFEIDYKLVHARMRKGKTFNEARAAL
jgi:hypothetical protein